MAAPPSPIVWFDLETGGLNPHHHQITQIAAIATSGDVELREVGRPFQAKVCLVPGRSTKEALELQGYDETTWAKEATSIDAAMRQFVDWCRPFGVERIGGQSGKSYTAASVGGYNVQFDADFLRATADRLKLWLPLTIWTGGMFDVLQFVKWVGMMDGEEPVSKKLTDVCEHYGIPFVGDAHTAIGDVRATIALARALLLGW